MRLAVQHWQGREFVYLTAQATAGKTAEEQMRDLFRRFETALKGQGLSLDNTVRSRIIARDRNARTEASNVRGEILKGPARSASSSYIWPDRFDGPALVSFDLWAARPSAAKVKKTLREYDPVISPLRYCIFESMLHHSGCTSVEPNLEKQIDEIVPRISESLAMAGTSWDKVVRMSFFLHRSQKIAEMRRLIGARVPVSAPESEVSFVDGYSSEGKLLEVETTALTL